MDDGRETRRTKTSDSTTNSYKLKHINLATVQFSHFACDKREEIIYLRNVKRN